jgi:hypothetical protein
MILSESEAGLHRECGEQAQRGLIITGRKLLRISELALPIGPCSCIAKDTGRSTSARLVGRSRGKVSRYSAPEIGLSDARRPVRRQRSVQSDPITVIPNNLLAAELTRAHESMLAATGSANSEATVG